jgi:hypothetical protein
MKVQTKSTVRLFGFFDLISVRNPQQGKQQKRLGIGSPMQWATDTGSFIGVAESILGRDHQLSSITLQQPPRVGV